jgi:uncharacterized membrane protein (UPF0127 family)
VKISIGGELVSVRKVGVFNFGLMFRGSRTDNLLFEFSKKGFRAITSFFVFFPFLAVWLDDKNNVVDWRVVKPFRFSINSKKKFRKLVEIPINDKNSKIIQFFVGKKRKV